MVTEWVPDHDWNLIVRSVPIVSVDLVVVHDGGVVLGHRTNEPAKGTWFVPGGRVQKGERFEAAVHRIAEAELGVDVSIDRCLGTYQHFYDIADVDGTGKHYVAVGYVVSPQSAAFAPDDQHETLQTFHSIPENTHEYTRRYLDEADII